MKSHQMLAFQLENLLLVAINWVELLALAVFGFSLIFLGRKVDYLGKPAAPVEHGHH